MIGAILDLTFYRGDTDNKCVNKRVCLVTQESSWTLCDPMDCSPPSSSVHGIFQARILEWAAVFSSRAFPNPVIKPMSPSLADGFFATEPPGLPSVYG